MNRANNIINIDEFKRPNQQQLIDHIGAQAFALLRESAEALNLPMKNVISEQILGLSLVMASVEGIEETQQTLTTISQKIENT